MAAGKQGAHVFGYTKGCAWSKIKHTIIIRIMDGFEHPSDGNGRAMNACIWLHKEVSSDAKVNDQGIRIYSWAGKKSAHLSLQQHHNSLE
eukprot:1157526-Pelagomonas_calceolata.AAC.2